MTLGELIDALDAARDRAGDGAPVGVFMAGDTAVNIPDLTATVVKVTAWLPDPDGGVFGSILLICAD